MKNISINIVREDRDHEVIVEPYDVGTGWTTGGKGYILNAPEIAEAVEKLAAANTDDDCDGPYAERLSAREQDSIADGYFANQL